MYPPPPRGRIGRSFEVGLVGRSPFWWGTRQQTLRGPEVWRPRRFVSYGHYFKYSFLIPSPVVWHNLHAHASRLPNLYFAAQSPFSLRGCCVPSKALFTAKHLTVFGLFRIALSKLRGEKRKRMSPARWGPPAMGAPRHDSPEMSFPKKV